MKNFKKIAVVLMAALLCASLYFNLKLSEPLYVIVARTPTDVTDSDAWAPIATIDSTKNRELYLTAENTLGNLYLNDIYQGDQSRDTPDLYIVRNIPDWGAIDMEVCIFLQNDISYAIPSGLTDNYNNLTAYILTEQDISTIKTLTNYQD